MIVNQYVRIFKELAFHKNMFAIDLTADTESTSPDSLFVPNTKSVIRAFTLEAQEEYERVKMIEMLLK